VVVLCRCTRFMLSMQLYEAFVGDNVYYLFLQYFDTVGWVF